MKNLKSYLSAAVAALAVTTGASALSFNDMDGSPTWLTASHSVTGWLDLTSGQAVNFNPATMTLTSAKVSFAFADTFEPGSWNIGPDSALEYVSAWLDTNLFLSGKEVDGTHGAYDWTSASGNLTGTLLTALQSDGKLKYKVKVTSGDVWFKGAKIEATADYNRVPDAGSTGALLVMSLLGLVALARRK